MNLIIVESPTKAKTLKRFLGDQVQVEASMGHVRDLPKSKLGVDLDKDFEPVYEVLKDKTKTISHLKKLAAKADQVILAMDPDREGEAIAFHTAYLLSSPKIQEANNIKKIVEPFSRVTFHEITKSAIEEAMSHPSKVNYDLVEAQQARRVLDRLVGYQLSPVLWKKVRRGLSAGRVQSVALRLITEREVEVLAFIAQGYVMVKAQLLTQAKAGFEAELHQIEGQRVVIKGSADDKGTEVMYLETMKQAQAVVDELKLASYVVKEVKRTERKRRALPPYTTSTLQQAAANVFGWSGKSTMKIAQQLYEAGMITYHRTDSTSLSIQAVAAAREVIGTLYGKEYLPEKPILYKTSSKSAQEAHEAIRPTDAGRTEIEGVTSRDTGQHQKLYELIRKRFLACQMMPAVYDQTMATIEAKATRVFRLRASGSIILFEGWRVLYRSDKKAALQESLLPEITQGEQVSLQQINAEQKETLPPPRFNDASLVKRLEEMGIGRPSTYASIISVLIDRGYVERLERRFHPTAVGNTVAEFLSAHFKTVMDYEFTAKLEHQLDEIAEGTLERKKMMKAFYTPFAKTIEAAEGASRVAVPVEETDRECPTCKEGKLVIRSGRFGKFLSCGRFPECKHTERLVSKLEDFACPECGSDVVLKRTKKGRTFWGCSGYPSCEWASWKDPRVEGKKS